MSISDPLADMLARVRNAQMRNHPTTLAQNSSLTRRVLDVMAEEGYIKSYKTVAGKNNREMLQITLKYQGKLPVIHEIKRISTPGRRVYVGMQEIPRTYNGLGISILSTPLGVISSTTARARNVGGELLCQIF